MPEPNDPFYVGYAPLPKRLRPWVLRFVLVWLVGLAGFAVVLATKQQDPGPGEWDLSKQVAIEGLLRVDPYPVLFVHDPKAGDLARAVLLVSEFKFGAQDRTQPFAGQAVRLQGHFISRGGRGMFELSSESDAIQALPNLGPNPEPTLAPTREPLGPCTLQGEIADSKCFLGVMKPGFGKTHRACAVRCISGGITPIFVTRDAQRNATLYVLTDLVGQPVNEAVLPFVAEPVEVQGNLERRGDLFYLAIDPGKIMRK